MWTRILHLGNCPQGLLIRIHTYQPIARSCPGVCAPLFRYQPSCWLNAGQLTRSNYSMCGFQGNTVTPAQAGKMEKDPSKTAVGCGLQINVIQVLYDCLGFCPIRPMPCLMTAAKMKVNSVRIQARKSLDDFWRP